ncbi:hypothetical protein QOZ80_9BG0718690 [Eleusine coracana subsp. coracana]|nr:hypothetical protein QOZ80_9BG0718690 [Eleusine coracana subsp. coracana]
MAALPTRSLAADRRWASVAAAPTRAPGAGSLEMAPKPTTNLLTQRDSLAWGNKPVPPASNALGSSSLLPPNNDEGSGSLTNINVRPASGGSSGSSTSGSDLLDSPLAWGQNSDQASASNVLTLHNSASAISRPQRIDSRSGSMQLSHFQTSFSEALKAPLRSIAKRGIAAHGKGFTLSTDDFPVLVSKISESKSQLGNSSQGRPTFSSGSVGTLDEQRKDLIAGGDPVSNTNLSMEAQKAQSHGTQAPNICMPPPWLDHWNPPPDHPPDRDRMWHRGAGSYGPRKSENTPGTGSLPVESLTHNVQTLLHEEGEARHGPVHSGYHPENRDSCYAPVPTDTCVKSLPHHIPGKVKDSHSVTLEKQPVIKKDLALLEKIRLLNIKAKNLCARKMSEISSCRGSKAEHPKSIDVKTNQVPKDITFPAMTNDIAAAFDLGNCVSECRNLVLNGPSNAPADCVTVDLSEEHVTESGEDRKPGKSADGLEKFMAKPEEVNSHSYARSHKSYNALIEADKILRKQKTGSNGTAEHDTSTTDACFIHYTENLNVPLTANEVKNAAVSISSTPPSDTAGVTISPLIRSVTSSANKTDLNLVEHIAQKSAEEPNDTIVQKLLPMESRQRQVHSRDRILRERSTIAESTEHVRNIARTLMATRRSEDKPREDLSTRNENRRPVSPHVFCIENTDRTLIHTRRSEDKPRVDLSTTNENRRPVSPHVFYTENTEVSSVHKNHTSGVVINSSIIPVHVASARGFTVGSIMIGDISLAFVNHEKKTVVKKVHDTVNGCESPQQMKQSGKDKYGVQLAKDAHSNDGVLHTPVKEASKNKQSEISGLNGTTIPAPTQSSGDHNIVPENVEPTKMSNMEKPACEEQDLQNLGQIAMVEGHTASYDNSSTSKLEEKKNHKGNEARRRDGRSSASGNQVSTSGLAPVGPKSTGRANSLLLNVMQELSDMSQQIESKTHVATKYRVQPTRPVLLPHNHWKMHLTGENQRQYHVDGQGDPQSTYANFKGTALPAAHLLPQPFPSPQIDALVNGVPGWTWDLNEGVLLSDMENFSGLGTTNVDRSSSELSQNVLSTGAVDLHGGQAVGGMVYQAANPGIQSHSSSLQSSKAATGSSSSQSRTGDRRHCPACRGAGDARERTDHATMFMSPPLSGARRRTRLQSPAMAAVEQDE